MDRSGQGVRMTVPPRAEEVQRRGPESAKRALRPTTLQRSPRPDSQRNLVAEEPPRAWRQPDGPVLATVPNWIVLLAVE